MDLLEKNRVLFLIENFKMGNLGLKDYKDQ